MAGDQAHGGGFATAGGAKENEEFAIFDVQIEPGKGSEAAKLLDQVFELDGCHPEGPSEEAGAEGQSDFGTLHFMEY